MHNAIWWCRKTWILIQVYFIAICVTILQSCCFLLQKKLSKSASNIKENEKQSQIAVVTGGTSGIGLALVKKLSFMNYTVIALVKELPDVLVDQVEYLKMDLGVLSEIRTAAEVINKKYHHIDVLVNCAGVMFAPLCINKIEMEDHFAINYLGHFYLTLLSMPLLKSCQRSRIINVTSSLHMLGTNGVIESAIKPLKSSYSPHLAYANSKLAMLLFTHKLQGEIFPNISAIAYDPGTVNTNLYSCTDFLTNFLIGLFGNVLLRNSDAAADDIIALINADLPKDSSLFCGWLQTFNTGSSISKNVDLQNRLWDFSMRLTELSS